MPWSVTARPDAVFELASLAWPGFRRLLRICLLSASTLLGQEYLQHPEDWQYLTSLAPMTSASEGRYGIYFSNEDGLLYYDYFTSQLTLRSELNVGLPPGTVHQVFNDPTTDALWVAYDDGIVFRMSTDDIWHEVPEQALPDHFQGRFVTRIGSSIEGVWIDLDGDYTQLNSFTGQFLRRVLGMPDRLVEWNVSRTSFLYPPELPDWFAPDDWVAGLYDLRGPGSMIATPTFIFRDRENLAWIGTDLGFLFRGDERVKILDILQAGVAPHPVLTVYFEGNKVWFADNSFRRNGRRALRGPHYFLSSWDEKVATWRHYSALESEAIRDIGVNRMLKIKGRLWLATMNGLVYLNTRTDDWGWIGSAQGLRDPAVWDMALHDGYIFIATARGVQSVDPISRSIVHNDSLGAFPRIPATCLWSTGESLYAGTDRGIFEYDKRRNHKWITVSELPAVSFWGDGRDLYAISGNLLYKQNPKSCDFELFQVQPGVEAPVLDIAGSGAYIWVATSNGAVLLDLKTRRRIVFDRKEGLPDTRVFSIEVTEDWVWFMTGAGVARFNWKAYFE